MNTSAEQATTQVQSQVDSQVSDFNGGHEEAFEGNSLSDGGSVASRETTSQAPPFEKNVKQHVHGHTVSPWDATDNSKANDEPESHDVTYWTGDPASSTSDDFPSGSEHEHAKGSMPISGIATSSIDHGSVLVDSSKYDPSKSDHLVRTGLPSVQTLSEATSAQAALAGGTVEPDETQQGVEATNLAQATVGGKDGIASGRDARSLWKLARNLALESIYAAGEQQNTKNTNVPTDQVAEAFAESDWHESSRGL